MPMLRLCILECCSIPTVNVSAIGLLYFIIYNRNYHIELNWFIFELQSLKREALRLFFMYRLSEKTI